jgi:CheY-like chemotaxis protein
LDPVDLKRSSDRAREHLVLLVDDDARNRALVRAILHDRCRVVQAGNGHDALTLIEYMQVDLVILDVMPAGNICRS